MRFPTACSEVARISLAGALLASCMLPPAAAASFPGRNGKIAFVKRGAAVYVVDQNGKHQRRVSNRSVAYATDPAWSPSARTLAFAAYPVSPQFTEALGQPMTAIYTVSPDGRHQRKLIGGGAAAPTWSPDGRRICFVRSDGLWTVRSNGRSPKRLLASASGVSFANPAWSPNGRQIAFETGRPDPAAPGYRKSYIDTVDAHTGSVAELTASGADFTPAWSPDGRRIVFHTHQPGASGIYVMNADGSGQAALPTVIQDHEPAWSPDGKKIVFTRFPVISGPNRIFTMSVNGTGIRLVTANGVPQTPDWARKPSKKRR